MPFPKLSVLLVCVLANLSSILHAGIVADALFSFPAQTEYLEYDNLTALRRLPNYNTLRQNFSGKPLEEAKTVLGQLGIQEDEVQEVVTGSTSTAFYGLIAGAFSGESVTKNGKSKRYAAKLLNTQIFCTGRETCIVFLEDPLAAFGSMDQLKNMLLARQGAVTRLTSNTDAVQLLNSTDRMAPVRGILFGGQIQAAVSDLLPDRKTLNIDPSRLTSTVTGVGYSVTFDSKAHLSAMLKCASGTAAALLSHMLSALGTLQSVTAPVLSTSAGLPFQRMQVSSSGNMVHFQADGALPAPTPGVP